MRQQADRYSDYDGRQNPETTGAAMDSALQLNSSSEVPAGDAPGYLPWLETVAPLHPRPGDRGLQQLFSLPSGGPPEALSSLIHDARNMVAAMDIYCDLLEEPGVLTVASRHYAGELRLVGGASRRLLDKLAALDHASAWTSHPIDDAPPARGTFSSLEKLVDGAVRRFDAIRSGSPTPAEDLPLPTSLTEGRLHPDRAGFAPCGKTIRDLAADLLANQSLLSAIAGPGVLIDLSIRGGCRPIPMAGEDLTRILVNLCRNAIEAMPGGGQIQIELVETSDSLLLTFSDNGPGIPESALETIFSSGFSSHRDQHGRLVHANGAVPPGWPTQHRGLGMAIVRTLVTAAGGSVWATNRTGNPEAGRVAQTGAVISLEFPLHAPLPGTHRGT